MTKRSRSDVTTPALAGKNRALASAAEGVRRFAGRFRVWRENDTRVMDRLRKACWGPYELDRQRSLDCPRWAEPMLETITATGRRMHRAQWTLVLGAVSRACRYSQGLCLSAEEAAAQFGCSRRTWVRWRGELEHRGILRVSRTYVGTCGETGRHCERNVYTWGPLARSHARGAMGEGLDSRARRFAIAARKRARSHRRERLRTIYKAQRPKIAAEAERKRAQRPDPRGGSDKVAPQSRSLRSGGSTPPPGGRGVRGRGRSVPATPVPRRRRKFTSQSRAQRLERPQRAPEGLCELGCIE